MLLEIGVSAVAIAALLFAAAVGEVQGGELGFSFALVFINKVFTLGGHQTPLICYMFIYVNRYWRF